MTRADWQNLNGLWDYKVTDIGATGVPREYDGQILVPYPFESALSGVMKAFLPSQRLWYHRIFVVPDSWSNRDLLLHFGAVTWDATVYVNGKPLGEHQGGYDEFSFDITKSVHSGLNDLVVAVTNPCSTSWQLRGKQTLHPAGSFFTACSGIWQTVWLEPVAHAHIETLKMVTDADTGSIELTVGARISPRPTPFTVTVNDGSRDVASVDGILGAEITPASIDNLTWYKLTSSWAQATVRVAVRSARLWSPDDPFLYKLSVTIKGPGGEQSDSVDSYAGIRSLRIGKDSKGNTRLYLNGKMTLLPMVLDQAYWPDGLYTAPTDEALRFDLEAEKALGVYPRKHVKLEPERWYYWADKLGILVLQDMPTGDAGDPHTDEPTSPLAASECECEMRKMIEQRWNHPSIISWDMFNEGWGQHDTTAVAAWAKALDPTRLIDETSGFPRHGAGDILDCHGGVPPKSETQISIDTENGSVGLTTPGHDWPLGQPWTPITFDAKTGGDRRWNQGEAISPLDDVSKAWFTRRVRSMFHSLWANTDSTGQTGDSYCQITDVEAEEDGLISYDRAVWKVDPAPIRAAARGASMAQNVDVLLPTAVTTPTKWRYTTVQPAADWYKPGFDASGWKVGLSAFGGGYDHIGTPWIDTPGEIWLRKDFTLASLPRKPIVRMIHDEDVQVYIDGVLACQDGGYISSYDDFALSSAAIAALKVGSNVIAVHCRQTTGSQVIDVGLFDDKD